MLDSYEGGVRQPRSKALRAAFSRQPLIAPLSIVVLGAAIGITSFAFYYSNGITLAHYDAKAHMVVARRIVDAITPGYLQMGTHWLPLTHLIYVPFVAFESQYRTGFIPSLFSVISFVVSGWLTFRISRRVTGSAEAGAFAALLLLGNANLEYLQSCPLTEPIYILLLLLTVDRFMTWREDSDETLPWWPAFWAALGGLCRYEGWYVLGGIVFILTWEGISGRIPRPRWIRSVLVYLALFSVPIIFHFGYLYWRVHDSFLLRVAQGNPVPFETYRKPLLSVGYHLGELAQISGILPLLAGVAGVVFCLSQRNRRAPSIPLFLLWLPSLVNVSALFWGMIYRVRYSVILVPAIAIFASLPVASEKLIRRTLIACTAAALLLPWVSWVFPHQWTYHDLYPGPGILALPIGATVLFLIAEARGAHFLALLLLCVLGMQIPILEGETRPILGETFEHSAFEPERRQVLDYLARNYDGCMILVDSLKSAPLIYDSGLPLKDFVYNEGNRSLWQKAIQNPRELVGWICVLKGDEISNLLNVDPHWADGYALVSQTNSLSLFRLKSKDRVKG